MAIMVTCTTGGSWWSVLPVVTLPLLSVAEKELVAAELYIKPEAVTRALPFGSSRWGRRGRMMRVMIFSASIEELLVLVELFSG